MSEAGAKDRPGRRRASLGTRLLLAAIAAFVGAEVVTRVVDWRAGRDAEFYLPPSLRGPQGYHTYEPHPYVGFVLRANSESRAATRPFSINSLGLRGPEVALEKPPGVYRIACLGGSTTFGTNVSVDEATYPARLQALLNEQPDAPYEYEVLNAGVSGYNTAESLVNFALRLVEYDLDAIVVYHAGNDARALQAEGFRPDYAHLRRSWLYAEISPLERFLLRWCRTYAWIARGHDADQQYGRLVHYVFVPEFEELFLEPEVGLPDGALDAYARNLRHLIALARANDVEVVLSTFAHCRDLMSEDEHDFIGAVELMNDRVRELAAQEGVALVDVDEAMSDKRRFFADWMHRNDEGADHHARIVLRRAILLGLFGLGD